MLSSSVMPELLRENVPLADMTWFRLGGAARYFAVPEDEIQLSLLLCWASEHDVPVRILGAGANVLVADSGFDGLVLRLDAPAFTGIEPDEANPARLTVGAGVDLMHLARDCSYEGLSGLEPMAGIPGTVGGALTMNAGGKFGEFSDVVESARLMTADGEIVALGKEDLKLGYRSSAVGDRIVLDVTIRLTPQPIAKVRERFRSIWAFKKSSQPMAAHSAGCIFKNPSGDSAGRIIDSLGLKGLQLGRARVSERHANFIVADDGATADEVLELVHRVQQIVRQRANINLELEIKVWAEGAACPGKELCA